jgi:hypothetical protein
MTWLGACRLLAASTVAVSLLGCPSLAAGLSCSYLGTDVVSASSQLGATFNTTPNDPSCAMIGASVVATAAAVDLICKAELFDNIFLESGWKVKDIDVDGDPFVLPPIPKSSPPLFTVVMIKAAATFTKIATVMNVTFESGAAVHCPLSAKEILKQSP